MKRLLIALALALSSVVLLFPASASAGTTVCTVQPGVPCYTGWGNNGNHQVFNKSTAGVVWCSSVHTDGSQTGEYGTVQPQHIRNFWAGGYNRMVCQYYSGATSIPLEIINY